MNAIVLKTFKTSDGIRIQAGENVILNRAISPSESIKIYEIIYHEYSFKTTESMVNAFFKII